MGWWCVSSCPYGSIKDWWESWVGLIPQMKSERAWGMLFFAAIWTTWELRNQVMFKNKREVVDQADDVVKFRVV